MNLLATAPIWLVALLTAALVAAAIEDVIRLRISNLTIVAVIATALIGMAVGGFSTDVLQNFGVFAALLIVGTFLFSVDFMGGGDVKLFAAMGLWTDVQHAPMLVATILIMGGVLALVFLFPRLVLRRSDGGPVFNRKKGVPYAVAIAIGSLLVVALQHQEAARHANPLEFRPIAGASFHGG